MKHTPTNKSLFICSNLYESTGKSGWLRGIYLKRIWRARGCTRGPWIRAFEEFPLFFRQPHEGYYTWRCKLHVPLGRPLPLLLPLPHFIPLLLTYSPSHLLLVRPLSPLLPLRSILPLPLPFPLPLPVHTLVTPTQLTCDSVIIARCSRLYVMLDCDRRDGKAKLIRRPRNWQRSGRRDSIPSS